MSVSRARPHCSGSARRPGLPIFLYRPLPAAALPRAWAMRAGVARGGLREAISKRIPVPVESAVFRPVPGFVCLALGYGLARRGWLLAPSA